MDEDELRDLQDPDTWDYENAEFVPAVEDAGAVVSVRFAADEFELLSQCAAEAGMNPVAFVRSVTLDRIAQPTVR